MKYVVVVLEVVSILTANPNKFEYFYAKCVCMLQRCSTRYEHYKKICRTRLPIRAMDL